MIVYVVTQQIGTWSKKSLVSSPYTDNTAYKSKFAAYRDAAFSKNWYIKQGFELIGHRVKDESKGEHSEHLVRVVAVRSETDQWIVIEVNKLVVL